MQRGPAEPKPPRTGIARLFGIVPFWGWLVLFALLGGTLGLSAFTFTYAQGFSYLSNDPKACVNCHIMRDVYHGWNHGSHKAVAGCNDCHTPHDSILSKYAVKALNGFRHSYAFTTGNFEEPIRILPFDRNITQHACLGCHSDMVIAISHQDDPNPTDCLRCHSGVGHGQ